MDVRGTVWRDGHTVTQSADLADLDQLMADPANLIWFDLAGPDIAMLNQLAGELGMDPHAVEDALAPHERPKVTRHENHNFLSIYALRDGAELDPIHGLQADRISAFVFERTLITVRPDDRFDMNRVVQRWLDSPSLVAYGVDGLLHGLLDVVIDDQFSLMEALDNELEGLEDIIFEPNPNMRELQRRTYRLRRKLVELRRVVLPMRDVVTSSVRNAQVIRNWPIGLRAYYDDLVDHVLRAADWSESLRDLVASVQETTLSLNDMRMNEVMKRLAAWAAIIAVPTLITGWFGMNVPYWGFSQTTGFFLAAGLVLVAMVSLFVIFRRRDWL